MQTLTMTAIYHRREDAMAQALDRFYATFPEIDGIALDTIRHFADEKFTNAATLEIVMDDRFPVEGPTYAYTLLVRESLKLATALKTA